MRLGVSMAVPCIALGLGCGDETTPIGGDADGGTTRGPSTSTSGSTGNDPSVAEDTTSGGATSSQSTDTSAETSATTASSDDGMDTSGGSPDTSTRDPVLPDCTDPLSSPAAPAAQALAQNVFDAIAPEATDLVTAEIEDKLAGLGCIVC